ncbi:MAG: PLP-dependent aminotransferase family protein, partial [Treponema sp.]|nr:PLP-dependent aminotransferase family protein [Treponema sp.]
YEKFPFSLWSHTMRQVLNSGDEKLLQRSQAKGVLELRKELSRYLLDFRNMNVSPEQIVIGAGTENLYALIVQLLGREKIYAVENPGYHKAEGVFRLNGVKTIPVNLDSQGISPEELEKSGAQVLHFSPSHHFPSGIVMPVRRRQEILRWAFSSPDRYILEDDYDSEFRFNGKPLLTLQSADSQNRVIYINTFSKTLAPSFRISYMVLPPDMLDYFEKKLGFYSCPVSSFEQYTLARFIQQGNFEKHIIRMKNYYRNLRNSLITAIQNSKLKEITKIQEKESGLHFLLTVNSEKSGQEIRENLEKNGINLPLIGEYYYGQAPQNLEKTFVVNYSGLKKEKIPETVRRLQLSFM